MLRHVSRQTLKRLTLNNSIKIVTKVSRPSLIKPIQNQICNDKPRYFHGTGMNLNSETYHITKLTTDRFHKLADDILEHMVGKLEEIGDETDLSGFDVEYTQGVMTISLGEHGTYVINKQPPNHQIWLSSPVSGPQRYDYDELHKKWFNNRTNETLEGLLNKELNQVFNEEIDLIEGYEPENH